MNELSVLETLYNEAVELYEAQEEIIFSGFITENINTLVEAIDKNKSIVSALVTSLITKICSPSQDIRLHRVDFEGGYSARSLDTDITTPFFKKHFPRYANKESGFLTLATRERIAWTKDAGQGLKIRRQNVKDSFLNILDSVQNNTSPAKEVLVYLFYKLHLLSLQYKQIFDDAINASDYASILNINTILAMMEKHFSLPVSSRLPVIAIYSLYEVLLPIIETYKGKILRPLNVHTSSDKHGYGDIEIWNADNTPFEMIEIKHNIPIDRNLILDVIKKSRNTSIQRYYVLTTAKDNFSSKDEEEYINKFTLSTKNDTGIDIIPNGIYTSMKYYLRFVSDYKQFIHTYTKNLIIDASNSAEIQNIHIEEWKNILKEHSIE
jgi:DNA (cytosine-5)-methyltransferase 1